MVQCLTPDCKNIIYRELDEHYFSCVFCKKDQCIDCKVMPYHEGMDCT